LRGTEELPVLIFAFAERGLESPVSLFSLLAARFKGLK